MARRKAVKPVAPPARPEEAGFLVALEQDTEDTTTRAAYADWLDEHDRAYEAAVQRDKAGLSEVWYKVRRKTDGLFAEPDGPKAWTKNGKRWRSLKQVVPHIHNVFERGTLPRRQVGGSGSRGDRGPAAEHRNPARLGPPSVPAVAGHRQIRHRRTGDAEHPGGVRRETGRGTAAVLAPDAGDTQTQEVIEEHERDHRLTHRAETRQQARVVPTVQPEAT